MSVEIDEYFKGDLREMLDIAVSAKQAYWDANRDVELMFSDNSGVLEDEVATRIEEMISTLASSSSEIGEDEVNYFLHHVIGRTE